VTTGTSDPIAVLGYQLRLPSFEGPLDVLLRLIERSQLQITDVSLVQVTEQFLTHIAELGGANPETIAEFTNVGTRLVLLKSRSLLPRPPQVDEEESASDLAKELIEYRAVKLAAEQLADRDRRGEGAFSRSPVSTIVPDSGPAKLAAHEANWLARALRRRLAVTPSPKSIMYIRPVVTIREMVDRVLQTLTFRSTTEFSVVTRQCRDAQEVRTAFLAMLLLVRRRVIDVDQPIPFGEITLRRVVSTPSAEMTDLDGFAVDAS
jgi:segregation and condensation protein A